VGVVSGVIVDGLAIYRVARLVARDRISEPVREWVEDRSELWGDGVSCVWCVGVWVAAGSVLFPRGWRRVRPVLAAATVAGVVGAVVDLVDSRTG
jgi:hypothetical protein